MEKKYTVENISVEERGSWTSKLSKSPGKKKSNIENRLVEKVDPKPPKFNFAWKRNLL